MNFSENKHTFQSRCPALYIGDWDPVQGGQGSGPCTEECWDQGPTQEHLPVDRMTDRQTSLKTLLLPLRWWAVIKFQMWPRFLDWKDIYAIKKK